MIVGTLCYYLISLVINTVVGDLYTNNLGCSILEISAQFLSGYLIILGFDLKKSIRNIFYIIGIAFTSCVLI